MRADGAAMREQLEAGASIHAVGGIDLTQFERQHIGHITKIQANVRGHLARKQLGQPRAGRTQQKQVGTPAGTGPQ